MNKFNRCKIESVTLLNWNGYFAKTFELDDNITTISGGNGVGKSTIMAAILVALVPDLSLLNFRNSTEAGSIRASKDKGIFGKIRPGPSYVILKSKNTDGEPYLFGVFLQQISEREGKLTIKTLCINGIDVTLDPVFYFTKQLNNTQLSQILNFEQLTAVIDSNTTLILKKFQSIIEYHGQLFNYGLLYKPFRDTSDRSKLYRLLEASLYGGISNSIINSLKDYLLTEPIGMKRAFQELESAVQENRLTLISIDNSEKTRNIFKNILGLTIDYVSSEYMRSLKSLKDELYSLINLRNSIKLLVVKKQEIIIEGIELTNEFNKYNNERDNLEKKLNDITNQKLSIELAIKQLERIEEIEKKIQNENNKLNNNTSKLNILLNTIEKERLKLSNLKYDEIEIKTKLEITLDLFNKVEVAKVEREKAKQLLELANKKLLNTNYDFITNPLLFIKNINKYIEQCSLTIKDIQKKQVICLENINQLEGFENNKTKAYELLRKIETESLQDYDLKSLNLENKIIQINEIYSDIKGKCSKLDIINIEYKNLISKLELSKKYQTLTNILDQKYNIKIRNQKHIELLKDEINCNLHISNNKINELKNNINSIHSEEIENKVLLNNLNLKYEIWGKAIECKANIQEIYNVEFYNLDEFKLLVNRIRRELTQKTKIIDETRLKMENLNNSLSNLGIYNNEYKNTSLLKKIADKIGGKTIPQLFENTSIDKANIFSSIWKEWENSIVVDDPQEAKGKIHDIENLINLKLCSYNSFYNKRNKDEVYEGFNHGNWIIDNDETIRFCKNEEIPWISIEAKKVKSKEILNDIKRYQELLDKENKELQIKIKLIAKLEDFITTYGHIDFTEDIPKNISVLKNKLETINNNKCSILNEIQSTENLIIKLNDNEKLINEIDSIYNTGFNYIDIEECSRDLINKRSVLEHTKSLKNWLNNWGELVEKLLNYPLYYFKDVDSTRRLNDLKIEYSDYIKKINIESEISWILLNLKSKSNILIDLFENKDNSLDDNNNEIELLKTSLESKEKEISGLEVIINKIQSEIDLITKDNIEKRSIIDIQNNYKESLKNELNQIGNNIPSELKSFEKSKLSTWLELKSWENIKSNIKELNTTIENCLRLKTTNESTKNLVNQEYFKQISTYRLMRNNYNSNNRYWKDLHLNNKNIKKSLYKPSIMNESKELLREKSDIALGGLKTSALLPKELKFEIDSLNRNLDTKIKFYYSVLNYLQDRIRSDIFQPDNPKIALEMMEIELDKLYKDLKEREEKLKISTKGVSNLIEKSLQREKLRIENLNEHLDCIKFGEVSAIRIKLRLKKTHESLLKILSDPEKCKKLIYRDNNEEHFFERIGRLYHQINYGTNEIKSDISHHKVGELLLDYRNYLDIKIEIKRKNSDWELADSGSLSTGEAIGTGVALLIMVIQSWEEEGKRLRGEKHIPFRFLMLDEAARLDSRSIETLYDLCKKLELQLLLASPEDIFHHAGTTYHLRREISENNESNVKIIGIKSK